MTDDLITWLRAQLDDDERVARAADVKQGDPEWWVSPVLATAGEHFTVRSKEDHRPIARVQRLDGDDDEPAAILDGAAAAEHIARHDPARVLAEVDAKRRILDRLAEDAAFDMPPAKAQAASHDEWYRVVTARDVIRASALPYAARPGYRDEWRP